MKIFKIINGGFSLTELLVSLGVLSIVALGVMNGVSYFSKESKVVKTTIQSDEFSSSIIEKILEGAKLYQVDYSSRTAIEILKAKSLPMAWSKTGIIRRVSECKKNECEHLLGRFGVVIKPITNHRGLYLATILLTHPSLPNGQMMHMHVVGL